MNDNFPNENNAGDLEKYPVEPRYHPVHKFTRSLYDFLASAKLAMALLVFILVCCVIGVTVWRGPEAGRLIFGTVWFNAVLVLLVVNVACCFFGRIWGRRVTLISFGMILFHLSFVVILLAIVFNSLFYFRGAIRVTEGETVPSGDPFSYDLLAKGKFFNYERLRGDTTLIKMHTGYKVSGDDKRAAYEVAVGEEGKRTQGVIYITHKLTHRGVDYFNDKEGYSLLLTLADKSGKEVYGAFVPLQSKVLGRDNIVYFTGYKVEGELREEAIPFPAPPEKPAMALKIQYFPAREKERSGEVKCIVYGLDGTGAPVFTKPIAEGMVAASKSFSAGDFNISFKEVRYWVGMTVRYEPGKPILLGSLWTGLAGMIITTVGRMMKGRKRQTG